MLSTRRIPVWRLPHCGRLSILAVPSSVGWPAPALETLRRISFVLMKMQCYSPKCIGPSIVTSLWTSFRGTARR